MLTPQLNAAFSAPVVRRVHFVQIALSNGYMLNLSTGDGTYRWMVDGVLTTFSGYDPSYGTIAGISDIKTQIAVEAGDIQITLSPPSDAGYADLHNPAHMGSDVRVWIGAVDDQTGQVIPDPVELWFGMWDTAKGTTQPNQRLVEINVIGEWSRFFAVNEGQRLNDAWHQSIWPGENALHCNVQALANPYWGQSAPSTPTNTPMAPISPSSNDYLSGITGL